jgi:hypothetical protein
LAVTLTLVLELHEKLLTREEELNSKEGAMVTWEDGCTTVEHAQSKANR